MKARRHVQCLLLRSNVHFPKAKQDEVLFPCELYLPLSLLNSKAFPRELHVILGTALSVSSQLSGLGTIIAKSSRKCSLFVSFTPIMTLSNPHSALGTPILQQ